MACSGKQPYSKVVPQVLFSLRASRVHSLRVLKHLLVKFPFSSTMQYMVLGLAETNVLTPKKLVAATRLRMIHCFML
jgi:hypothetical protein